MREPTLYVALNLDPPENTPEKILALARQLNRVEGNFGYKLNGDFLSKYGIGNVVPDFAKLGRPVFADMKMLKGKSSMGNMIDDLSESGANYTNLYALARRDFIEKSAKRAEEQGMKLLAVTVLTYETDDTCMENYGRNMRDSVKFFAEKAHSAGCHGLILPSTTLSVVEHLDMEKFTPGIRPTWDPKYGDQKQVLTPSDALRGGADSIVIGGTICDNENPTVALERVLDEMNSVKKD